MRSRAKVFFPIAGLMIAVASIPFCLHDFVPGGQAVLDILGGKGAFGQRQNDVTVKVDGQEQAVRAYVANLSSDGIRPGKRRTVVLTELALKNPENGKPEIVNWKVTREAVGATHDHQAVFLPAWWGLLAGEGVHITYPIEDDMKGFNAEYTITDSGSSLHYNILFPLGKGTKTIGFSIPKEMLGIRNNPCRKPLHILPYRLREKTQNIGKDNSE